MFIHSGVLTILFLCVVYYGAVSKCEEMTIYDLKISHYRHVSDVYHMKNLSYNICAYVYDVSRWIIFIHCQMESYMWTACGYHAIFFFNEKPDFN